MTPEEARIAVDVAGHTLARVAAERVRHANASDDTAKRVSRCRIEEGLVAVGLEVERIVRFGHASALAQLGTAVERWR